jgi:hypothetical protein
LGHVPSTAGKYWDFQVNQVAGASISGCFAVIAVALALGGCRCQPEERGSPEAAASIARGEHVVVEQTAAEFFEGRVLDVEPDGVRVEALDGGASRRVASGDIYRIAAVAPLAVGNLAICRTEPASWVGCRIDAIAERVTISTALGEPHDLAVKDVVVPTPVTELNIRRSFERTEKERAFAEAAREAGVPRAPDGWHPAPRERVVAKSGKAWFSAHVREIEDDGVHVEWRADERITKVGPKELVPEPPSPTPLHKGSFALLRPSVVSRPWKPVRVDAEKDGTFAVTGAAGEQTVALPRDLLPLSK